LPEQAEQAETVDAESGQAEAPASLPQRALKWVERGWRPATTVVAVILAGLLMWHVINGEHGISVWQKKRVEDQQLRKEIEELEQENARLREHIDHLKNDPEAIAHEAREKLHYAKPGEVIYTLPEAKKPQTQPQATGK
jgi:cell division protein FtsB